MLSANSLLGFVGDLVNRFENTYVSQDNGSLDAGQQSAGDDQHGGHGPHCMCDHCLGLHVLPLPSDSVPPPPTASSVPVPAPLNETFNLHSNPGASKVIYLDFTGHTTSGTIWNSAFNNGQDIVTPAYSFTGDASFADSELTRIQAIWRRVSEDFLPFDVNVTTEEPTEAQLRKFGAGDTEWGVRVVIGGNNSWFGGGGGVAYVGSFNYSSDTPIFVFEDNLGNGNEKYTAEASSHEAGHALGLNHDGRTSPSEEYYAGHGSGATGWAPIMGNSYSKSLTQWSKGEYSNPSNTQDDLQIITSQNGFGYRQDDYGDTIAQATSITYGAEGFDTEGIIERNDDYDVLSFTTGGGDLDLDILPADYGPNLDIAASLFNAAGQLIVSSNPIGSLAANLVANLAAGQYYVQVTGVGEGNPQSGGYSDYGSLGYYRLDGEITGGSSLVAVNDSFSVNEDGGVADLDVLANDPDSGSLTISAVGNGSAGGSISIVNGDSIRYEPADDYNGQETFTYTVTDGAPGSFATATVTVTVAPTNDAPTAVNDSASVQGGSSNNTINVLANDSIAPDTGETLTITAVTQGSSGGSVSIASGQSVRYTPANGFSGQETFTYTVNDGTPGSNDTATVTVSVSAVNNLPDANNDSFTVAEDSGNTDFDVLANDNTDSGETLTIVSVGTTSNGGTVGIVNGDTIRYRPAADFNGTETFTYTVNDGTPGNNDTATVTVNVTPVNDPPVAVNDNFSVAEDSGNTDLDVLANDSTEAGETLTIISVGSTSNGGTVGIVSGNRIRYRPAADFSGTETFTYTINDGNSGSNDTATVTVSVNSQNDPPNANNDSFTVAEDSGNTDFDVLANDNTESGETLTIISVGSASSGGTIGVVNGNTIRYRPAANFNGTETFTYTINDGTPGSNDTATVTVNVTPVNDPPVAVNDNFSVAEDSGNTDLDVLANDSTEAGETLTIISVGSTSNGGTVGIVSGNRIRYRPAADFSGTETFTYTINDGNSGSNDTATVTVSVNSQNDPPNANNDSFTVAEDSGNTDFDVLANDSTESGETLTIISLGSTSNGGTVGIVGGDTIRYRPAADFHGTETFTYTINDGTPGSNDTATVTVNVTPVNDPPVAVNDSFSVAEDSGNTDLDVLANDSTEAGETLTIVSVGSTSSGGTVGIVNGNAIRYRPAANFSGTETFTYTINDGNSGSNDTATVTVSVNSQNDPPNANNDSFTVAEDSGNTDFDVLANDSTESGETLTIISLGSTSNGGTVGIVGGDTIRYRPAANFHGTETFTYTINDGTPGSNDTATVTVTVTPVNDPPVAVNDSYSVSQGSGNRSFDVLANDSTESGETLTIVSVGSASAGGTVSIAGGNSITYRPAANFSGTETFTYTINDGNSGSNDTATVTVNVVGATPYIDFDLYSIDSYGGAQDGNGTATVENGGATLRLEGNTWKKIDYSYEVTPNTVIEFDFQSDDEGELHVIGFDTNVGASSSYGFQVYGTQNWGRRMYKDYADSAPQTKRYSIPVGQYYTGSFTNLFFANDLDAGGQTAEATFSNIRVFENVDTNEPPTAVNDSYTVEENSGATTFNVLQNDSADSGETLTIASVGSTSAGGTVSIVNGTSIRYTPANNFSGTETFTYTINDGTPGNNDTATVTVTVSPSSQPGGGEIDFRQYTVASYGGNGQDKSKDFEVQNSGTTLQLSGNTWRKIDLQYTVTPNTVLEFDFSSTKQGEVHTIGFDTDNGLTPSRGFSVYGSQVWGLTSYRDYASSAPEWKSYSIPVGQFYTGTFSNLFFGNDHDVSNPDSNSRFANVHIFEAGASVGPGAVDDTFSTNEDSSTISLDVLDNDTAADGATLTIESVGSASDGGTVNVVGGTQINYRPAGDFFGTETFTYTISDDLSGQTSTATVTVNVNPRNDDPNANADSFTVSQNSQNNLLAVLQNDSIAPDTGETLSIVSVGNGSAGGSLSIVGDAISYTPASGFTGTETFSYTINDGTAGSNDSATVTVTVEEGLAGIDFSQYSILSYGGKQDVSKIASVEDNGATLHLSKNTWKAIEFSYTVTASTVLEFEFRSPDRGEVHAIGFDNDRSLSENRGFTLYGSQNWGNNDFKDYGASAPGWQLFQIPVGQFYTGNFDYLFFGNDHDIRRPTAESYFRNVRMFDASTAPTNMPRMTANAVAGDVVQLIAEDRSATSSQQSKTADFSDPSQGSETSPTTAAENGGGNVGGAGRDSYFKDFGMSLLQHWF